jgi:hypothetical protein
MASLRLRGLKGAETPSNLSEWLDKWQPRVGSLNKRKGRASAVRASGALDELEFLLMRTVGKDVTE